MPRHWQPVFKGTWVPMGRLVGEFGINPLRHLLLLSDASISSKRWLLLNEILSVVCVSSGGNQFQRKVCLKLPCAMINRLGCIFIHPAQQLQFSVSLLIGNLPPGDLPLPRPQGLTNPRGGGWGTQETAASPWWGLLTTQNSN